MQINSIGQQTNFKANMLYAKKALAIDPKTKQVVASYTNFTAPFGKFIPVVLNNLPGCDLQGKNMMFLKPKDFGDIICISCKDGQASRENVIKYLNNDSKGGFDKIVIEQ